VIKLLLQPLLAAGVVPLFVDPKSVQGQAALILAALRPAPTPSCWPSSST